MSPEAQRIAIARHLGAKRGKFRTFGFGIDGRDMGDIEGWFVPWKTPIYDHFVDKLPDYLNDLNAMNEAEKTLTDDLHSMDLSYRSVYFNSIKKDSSASVRAEKFLKTIGKWKK